MAVVRELVTLLRYRVDQSGLTEYAQKARTVGQQVSGLGRAAMLGARQGLREALAQYGLVPGKVIQGIREQRRLNAEQRKSAQNVKEIGGGYSSLTGYIRTALAAVGVAATAGLADEWAGIEARVGLVTDGIEQQQAALKSLYATAQSSGQDYLSMGDLFYSIQRNAKDLDLTDTNSLRLSEVIGKAMTIGGGPQASQQAALVQLSQALGSGQLRGQELRSVLEQAPRLAQAIAESFGVPIGQLIKLGEQGALTSKDLAEGLLRIGEKIDAEFERMPKTFGRGMTLIRNAWGRFIWQMNRASAASETFYGIAKLISQNMAEIVKIGAMALLAAGVMRLLPLLRSMRGGAIAALWPFLRMYAILETIRLIGDDVLTWLRGGRSVLGGIIGRSEEWKEQVEWVKRKLDGVKNLLGGGSQTLGEWIRKWGTIGIMVVGLWALLGPIKPLLAWVAFTALPAIVAELNLMSTTSLGRFLGVWVAVVFALKWIYDNADKIAAKLESAFGVTFDRLKQKFEDMVPEWIKWTMKNITGGSAGSEWQKGLNDDLMSRFNERAGKGMGTPQSYRGGDATINQEITVNAPSSNPAALARSVGNEAGRMTNDAVRTSWGYPNVEALA